MLNESNLIESTIKDSYKVIQEEMRMNTGKLQVIFLQQQMSEKETIWFSFLPMSSLRM